MRRYLDSLLSVSRVRSLVGYGLRSRLKEGYTTSHLRADLMAGLVVGVVALPLSMALSIASGVEPQRGLYTAIVAGIVASLLGGTRVQVTGPTAAFVVLLVPVVAKFGLGGLLVAGLLAGFIQLLMGVFRLGSLITFIPHPVTTGFTTGIAVVIATLQVKDVFGLELERAPESYLDRWQVFYASRQTASLAELAIAAFTLALLLLGPRLTRRIPAPLLAIPAAALLALVLTRVFPGFEVATIGSRFTSEVGGKTIAGIPPLPPLPVWPFTLPGADGAPFHLDFATLQALFPSALAIAMLGAIESLLSAVVADGMTRTRHDPNAELIGLGVANIVCPLFGGIAATGALARTAANVRAGAESPLASVFHALFILASTVALAPLVAYLPMAALAALLLVVAKNMSEMRHFLHLLRVAPRSDVLVLLVCFFLTVFFDMVLAVGVGVVLAALLFMRRMAELTNTRLDTRTLEHMALPEGVLLYEIAGPLFFGAAQKAMGVLETVHRSSQAVILSMGQVPTMDATGLVAFETLLANLRRHDHKVILAGLQPNVRQLLDRANITREAGKLAFAPDLEVALSMAILHTARGTNAASAPSVKG